MYERDKNLPCISLWSLGNEAGYGPALAALAAWLRAADDTRPVHYEVRQQPCVWQGIRHMLALSPDLCIVSTMRYRHTASLDCRSVNGVLLLSSGKPQLHHNLKATNALKSIPHDSYSNSIQNHHAPYGGGHRQPAIHWMILKYLGVLVCLSSPSGNTRPQTIVW